MQESLTFEDNAALDLLWYVGDADELSDAYAQLGGTSFWTKSARSRDVQRIHTGLPGEIADTLAQIVVSDMLPPEIPGHTPISDILAGILEENDFAELLENAVVQTLFIGDGAFRITFDEEISDAPILQFIPGDRVLFETRSGRITEIIFLTKYAKGSRNFVFREHYGAGYIRYVLTDSYGTPLPLDAIEETAGLEDIEFDTDVALAVPLKFRSSARFTGRGRSIFDRKRGSFDALDEAWSQWMHAVRKSHARTYIPESLARYNGQTGEPMKPDDFTDNFILVGANMAENGRDQIVTAQPHVEHEGYLAAYMTALDLCLQGLISPSTLGIDVKKLDNAEAQREKEKATLYTRSRIVQALQKALPKLFAAALYLHAQVHEIELPEHLEITVPFGEYANPSFEAQVETLGKAKSSRILSNEALVEELWGDTKTAQWKAQELSRLEASDGLTAPADEVDF